MKSIKQWWKGLKANESLKKRLYIIIFESDTREGKLFDTVLIGFIVSSILVVILDSVFRFDTYANIGFQVLEYLFTAFFTFEYLVRLYCSPNPRQYAFSFFGIVDLLSTLPLYLGFFLQGARYLLIVRSFRLIRVFRVFKLFSFLNEGNLLMQSLWISRAKIGVFFLFVLILNISIGTLMYVVEGNRPDTPFTDIPASIYWSIVTMTTVGYGDITPITGMGRFLSAVVMLFGYTIIAIPTGIVSAALFEEGRLRKQERSCPHCRKQIDDTDARYCPYCGQLLSPQN
ncbi:MAG: ion transporter [Parabacteroides sp.]|nr:ion transporter [Parabacteroides sp.]MDD6101268.1 ion transporter [bacterium]MDD6748618.1 ion transporter [bacterium]MDD6766595.1 ion transporter [bacterium]MDD6837280.1 ion transporter [bacterium]